MLEIIITAIIVGFLFFYLGKWIGAALTNHKWQLDLPDIRHAATKQSRAVLGGQISEQLAPFLPDFPYLKSEARFVGKPIDFIIFKGMDNQHIEEVVFVEVKSGEAGLSKIQQSLKNAIENRNVKFVEYRIPKARQ